MKKYSYLAIIKPLNQDMIIQTSNGKGIAFKIDKRNNLHIYSYIFKHLPFKKETYIINDWTNIIFDENAYKELSEKQT
jgi:hypothetical protein